MAFSVPPYKYMYNTCILYFNTSVRCNSQVPDKCHLPFRQLEPHFVADLKKSFSRSGLTLAATEALEVTPSLDPLTKWSHMPSIPNESTPPKGSKKPLQWLQSVCILQVITNAPRFHGPRFHYRLTVHTPHLVTAFPAFPIRTRLLPNQNETPTWKALRRSIQTPQVRKCWKKLCMEVTLVLSSN